MTDTTVIKIPEDFKVTNKTYSEVGKLNEVEKILEGYGMKEALYDSSFKELTKELNTLIENKEQDAYDRGKLNEALMQKEPEFTTNVSDTTDYLHVDWKDMYKEEIKDIRKEAYNKGFSDAMTGEFNKYLKKDTIEEALIKTAVEWNRDNPKKKLEE